MIDLAKSSIIHGKDCFHLCLSQLVRSEALLANALSLVEWYDLIFDEHEESSGYGHSL